MSRTHPLVRSRSTRPSKVETTSSGQPSPPRQHTQIAKVILAVLFLGAIAALAWLFFAGGTATILVLGVDQRPEESGPTRADVIMLLHTERGQTSTAMVSVPRDLWLTQPDGSENRINTATVTGYSETDEDAGPRYLARTLEENFGITVDGYVLLNFDTFLAVVDAVGGVDINVPRVIVDEQYPTPDYGTTTIRFEAGPQHLDAEQALIYVRTRHADSDFGRAARQQQVIQAVAGRLLSPQHWLQIPGVIMTVLRSVQADLPLTLWPGLMQAARQLAAGQVETLVLGDGYVTPFVTESGAYVLLPHWEAIRPALSQLMAGSSRP